MTGEAVEVAADALEKQVGDMKISEMGDSVKPEKRTEKGSPRKGRSYEERLKEWEEKQVNKEVVERGCKGTVKWYSVSGRYGFIARGDGIDDVFVHQSAITKSTAEKFWQRSLADNQKVEFDLLKGEKGLEAGNVTGPDGEPVKSSPFRRFFNYPRGAKYVGRRRERMPKKEGEEADGKDEGGDEKPRRRFRNRPRHNKNKPDNEKKDGEEKPKRVRHRRNKSESKPDAAENVKEGGEDDAPTADAKE